MNPVSLCMIVKNEEKNIEKLLQSVKPWFNDIVVVDTGSMDSTAEICKKYANTFLVFTDCNDENGDILDFSMARNKAFSLAKNNILMWVDGDDIIDGLENLSKYVEKYKNIDHNHFIQAPYEYSYDENGKCTLVHYRERIFFGNPSNWNFVNNVHEVCMAKPGVNASSENIDDIVWKHQRQYVEKQVKPDRNLRILQAWIDKNGEEKDARQLYYIGLEYGNSGNVERSRYYLEKYIAMSGWADEIYMALLRLIVYSMSEQDYNAVIDYALRAIKVKPEWAEAYFEAAKACYSLANEGKDEYNNWNKCINFARIGLSLPVTKTVLFVNPLERDLIIHKYLNFALNKVGDIEAALVSVNKALETDPNDAALIGNKKIYDNEMFRRQFIELVSKYREDIALGQIEQVFNTFGSMESSEIQWKPYHRPPAYPKDVSEKDFPIAVVSPHSQAWAVPEVFVYEDLPVRFNHKQLIALTVEMTKQFILHDELTSAILFLENAPTMVRDSNEVESILRKVKSMTEWTKDEKDFDKWNAPLDSNLEPLKTEMVPLPYPLVGQAGVRLNLMTDRMPDKNKSVMELGAIDGEMAHRVKMMGYKEVVGVDGCESSIKVAIDAGKRNNLDTVLIHSFFDQMDEKLKPYGEDGKFDYVFTSDTVEHLHSPVEQLLIPAFHHLKDDGKFLLTCPHQSLYRGEFRDWVHPWLSAYEPKSLHWLELPRRGHLIAPTVWSMVENVRKAGFFISEAFRFAFPHQDVPDQGQIVIESFKKFPENYENGKDIVFYLGYNVMSDINPHKLDVDPVGGSETALREMTKCLSKMGHRVRVYADCGKFGEGIFDGGVEWRMVEKYHDINCDVLITSRQAEALDDRYNNKAKLNIIWSHDLYPAGMNHIYAHKADIIFALSNWHKQFMLETIPYLKPEKIIVTGNGIDLSRFDQDANRDQYKILCSSSADRYLPAMLDIFPRVKAIVPEASLSVAYSFRNWEYAAQNDSGQIQLIQSLKNRLKEMESVGVHYLGGLDQKTLAREFLSAGVWALPSHFTETNCVGLSECFAAGCIPVVSNNAALGERMLEGVGFKLDGDWLSKEYQDAAVEKIVECLLHPNEESRKIGKKFAQENLSWDKFAKDWDSLFSESLTDSLQNHMKTDILPYIPLYERVS